MDIFFPYDDYFSGEEEELQKKETKLQEEETKLQEETNSQRYKVNLNRYRNFKCSREEKDDMIYVYKKYFLTKKKTKVQCVDICFEICAGIFVISGSLNLDDFTIKEWQG